MSEAHDTILDAFLDLLNDRRFDEVTLRTVARRAGVSLAVMNVHYATRGHLIDAFAKRIDTAVLEGDFSDMADEPGRERLFDVLMARFEACKEYRGAIKTLLRAGRRDAAVGMTLNAVTQRSMAWMLAAAGLSATGWRGRMAIQGLTLSFARVLRVFVDEDDAGLPRTMARLDKELRELEARHNRFARMFGEAVRPDQPDPVDATPAAAEPEVKPEPEAEAPTPPAEPEAPGESPAQSDVPPPANDIGQGGEPKP
ncbi:MAG: TetR/AcrR family transcriptional regulator [Pseudomonadota bacterium]